MKGINFGQSDSLINAECLISQQLQYFRKNKVLGRGPSFCGILMPRYPRSYIPTVIVAIPQAIHWILSVQASFMSLGANDFRIQSDRPIMLCAGCNRVVKTAQYCGVCGYKNWKAVFFRNLVAEMPCIGGCQKSDGKVM